jgi:hypothetical protein
MQVLTTAQCRLLGLARMQVLTTAPRPLPHRYARVWPHVRELLQALTKHWSGTLTEPLLGALREAVEGATSGYTGSAVLGTRGGPASGGTPEDGGGDGEGDEADEDGRVVAGAHEGAPDTAREGGDPDDAPAERAAPITALASAVDRAWESALEPSPQVR